MTVPLPTYPAPAEVVPVPLRAGNDLESPIGSSTVRIERLGNKFRFEIVMPPMDRPEAEDWLGALLSGLGTSVSLQWPQPLGGVGAPGAPVVNGAGQAGMLLNLRGFNPAYFLRRGQGVSLLSGSQRQFLIPQALATAGVGGLMTLSFWPMLRFSPADGATLEVVQPVMQGLLGGNSVRWKLDVAMNEGLSFTITENYV